MSEDTVLEVEMLGQNSAYAEHFKNSPGLTFSLSASVWEAGYSQLVLLT